MVSAGARQKPQLRGRRVGLSSPLTRPLWESARVRRAVGAGSTAEAGLGVPTPALGPRARRWQRLVTSPGRPFQAALDGRDPSRSLAAGGRRTDCRAETESGNDSPSRPVGSCRPERTVRGGRRSGDGVRLAPGARRCRTVGVGLSRVCGWGSHRCTPGAETACEAESRSLSTRSPFVAGRRSDGTGGPDERSGAGGSHRQGIPAARKCFRLPGNQSAGDPTGERPECWYSYKTATGRNLPTHKLHNAILIWAAAVGSHTPLSPGAGVRQRRHRTCGTVDGGRSDGRAQR